MAPILGDRRNVIRWNASAAFTLPSCLNKMAQKRTDLHATGEYLLFLANVIAGGTLPGEHVRVVRLLEGPLQLF